MPVVMTVSPRAGLPARWSLLMPEPQFPEIEQLRAECAAQRAVLAILIASLHGRSKLGSVDDWRDGVLREGAAKLAGSISHPAFNAAIDRMRDDVLRLNGLVP